MQCVKCKDFFPPGFATPTKDGKAAICCFCEQEKPKIKFVVDATTGESVTYSKQHVIDEYKKYLNEVKDNPNIKKLIVDDAVKKMKEAD